MSTWSFGHSKSSRRRRLVGWGTFFLPAALLACNAIIGTEDRYLAADGGAKESDASNGGGGRVVDGDATTVSVGDDGSAPGSDAADGAIVASDASVDAGPCIDGGTCTLPAPIAVFPAITSFDLDPATGTLYIAPAGEGSGIYTVTLANKSAGPVHYWTDMDAGAGTGDHTVLKMHVSGSELYFIEHSTTNDTNYLHTCGLAPAGCASSPLVRLVSAGTDFFVGNQFLFWWGGDQIDYVPISSPAASNASSSLVGVAGFLGGAAGLFATSASGVTRYTPSGQIPLASPVTNTATHATNILATNGSVYAADTAVGQILQLASGFSASDIPNVVAGGQASPTNVATDGANLFWLTAAASGAPASLVECAIGSSDATTSCTPSRVHAFQNPTGLLVTATAFFVLDAVQTGQAIYQLPR